MDFNKSDVDFEKSYVDLLNFGLISVHIVFFADQNPQNTVNQSIFPVWNATEMCYKMCFVMHNHFFCHSDSFYDVLNCVCQPESESRQTICEFCADHGERTELTL